VKNTRQNTFHMTTFDMNANPATPSFTMDLSKPLPNPPKAGFDTYVGTGHGTIYGKPARILIRFTDFAEPGTAYTANYVICNGVDPTTGKFNSAGTLILNSNGNTTDKTLTTSGDQPLIKGNQQARCRIPIGLLANMGRGRLAGNGPASVQSRVVFRRFGRQHEAGQDFKILKCRFVLSMKPSSIA
jgi:hypothetical protein